MNTKPDSYDVKITCTSYDSNGKIVSYSTILHGDPERGFRAHSESQDLKKACILRKQSQWVLHVPEIITLVAPLNTQKQQNIPTEWTYQDKKMLKDERKPIVTLSVRHISTLIVHFNKYVFAEQIGITIEKFKGFVQTHLQEPRHHKIDIRRKLQRRRAEDGFLKHFKVSVLYIKSRYYHDIQSALIKTEQIIDQRTLEYLDEEKKQERSEQALDLLTQQADALKNSEPVTPTKLRSQSINNGKLRMTRNNAPPPQKKDSNNKRKKSKSQINTRKKKNQRVKIRGNHHIRTSQHVENHPPNIN
eukprot:UN22860